MLKCYLWCKIYDKTPALKQSKTLLIGDGHVHIHSCFDLDLFWQSAWNNFARAASRYDQESTFKAVLFLTESQGVDWFSDFKKKARQAGQKGRWKFQETEESRCLRVHNDDGEELWLVAGRQIVTAENLEVLGLGVEEHYTDGKPISEVVEWINSQDGVVVIPWGVGKWIGPRGKCMKALIENPTSRVVFLGDSGNRPVFWPLASIFARGQEKGVKNIPGSDPLPLSKEDRRAGSYGFILPEFQCGREPVKDIIKSFESGAYEFCTYGKKENPIRFFKKQFSMQLVKRKNKAKIS